MSYWHKEYGADVENRTPVISLEDFSSTIELHPHGVPNISARYGWSLKPGSYYRRAAFASFTATSHADA